jgi:hypothetical protein
MNMKPGIYRLTEDVRNPEADLRTRNDWRTIGSWKAGTCFVIVEAKNHLASEMVGRTVMSTRIWAKSFWAHQDISLDKPAHQQPVLDALLPKLVPVIGPEADFDFWFASNHHENQTARSLLLEAFRQGRIDLAWMEQTSEAILKADD